MSPLRNAGLPSRHSAKACVAALPAGARHPAGGWGPFRHPNPVIFVPVDFVAVGLYLLYIDFAVGGHWFLSFAFPVTGAIGLLVTAVVTLTHYLHGGYLFIYGGGFILSGALAVLIEFLLNLTFQIHETFFWSFYPLVAGVVIGSMLIVIAVCKPLRESLHRKFFL